MIGTSHSKKTGKCNNAGDQNSLHVEMLHPTENVLGAQEGSQLDTLTALDADAPVFNAFFGVTVIFHVPLAALENWHFI